jgi:4-phosphopantoate---beta-alanine ligase
MTEIPCTHPRFASLKIRTLIEEGVAQGITSTAGLIAHGRGEAFDYLLGEDTYDFALEAMYEAVKVLKTAKHPIISVNGNTAVLVPDSIVKLSKIIQAPLEVNIFHSSKEREVAIANHLQKHGAENVLLPSSDTELTGLESNRRFVNPEGIAKADVVFVPLEDGDRCEYLVKRGVRVITVDLNPLSRTARTSHITIVDNVVRAIPALINLLLNTPTNSSKSFSNREILIRAEKKLRAFSQCS